MNEPSGIIIFGANGSGKTTLGRETARILNFKHMDIEDYCFLESKIPYTKVRPKEEYIGLALEDIIKYRNFVITSVDGDFGDIIPQYYKLGVSLSAPLELRIERVKKRAFNQHGKRVLKGGDMYEQELKFFDFVVSRSLSKVEKLEKSLSCPVIYLDGTEDINANAGRIVKAYQDIKD